MHPSFSDALLQTLLTKRGVNDDAAREMFLTPNYEAHTHNPLLLKDAHKAAERIIRAIENGEVIGIFSDYDADGIPGAVIAHDFFKKVLEERVKQNDATTSLNTFSTVHYIPDRHNEGFGLSVEAVEGVYKKGVTLLITIDCGITDVIPVARANELGIDVIITDHHIVGKEIPNAYAIIDPKQTDCAYPEKMLCGSGVFYKLIQAVLAIHPDRLGIKKGYEKWLLDMVGIATLSDMVPLLGENRIFATYGLQVLRKSPRIGLTRLLKDVKVNQQHLSEDDIGFMVTPRINAASRMGSAYDAFRLLSTTDEGEAGALSKKLQQLNDERKGIVASIAKEAKKMLEDVDKPLIIVLGNPSWRPSLLGLVANTLVETYNCPVFLWGREGADVIKGSCRAPEGISVVHIMHAVPAGTFIDAGGHHGSGGFSIEFDAVHTLPTVLLKAYKTAVNKSTNLESAAIDAELSVNDVNQTTWNVINQCAPYGHSNPKPLFGFKNAPIVSMKQFGKTLNHLEITFINEKGKQIKAIAFFSTYADFPALATYGIQPFEQYISFEVPIKLNFSGHIELSHFMNRSEIRLRIVDILPA